MIKQRKGDENPTMTNGNSAEPQGVETDTAFNHITHKLREFYDSVQDEGIPDRFLDLLEKLDEAEKKSQEGK